MLYGPVRQTDYCGKRRLWGVLIHPPGDLGLEESWERREINLAPPFWMSRFGKGLIDLGL